MHDIDLIVSGSSITNDGPWPTWATFLPEFYQISNFQNISQKGLGNKVIILKAVQAAYRSGRSGRSVFLILQLTSLDKWDWFVTDPTLCHQLKNEKHALIEIVPGSNHGFWSTGSHFPLWKEYYRSHYFSIEYQAYETISTLQWFEMLCQKKGWRYHVILDSPIFSVTESELNQGHLDKTRCYDTDLMCNVLCDILQFDHDYIYLPGLIGYACLHDLAWFSRKYKGHPGSFTHYLFLENMILPVLDAHMSRKNVDLEQMLLTAKKYQNLLVES